MFLHLSSFEVHTPEGPVLVLCFLRTYAIVSKTSDVPVKLVISNVTVVNIWYVLSVKQT